MARGVQCTVHHHEYATSQEHHHLQPLSRGGPTQADNLVWLCSNAHGDVHCFLDLIEFAAKKPTPMTPDRAVSSVPFTIAKHYSPAIRRAAATGWHRYAADFLAGKYDAHHLLWATSGQPRQGLVYPLSFATAARWNDAEYMLARARRHLSGDSKGFPL